MGEARCGARVEGAVRWAAAGAGVRGGDANLQHFLVGAVAEEEGGDALAAEGLGERVEAAVAVVGERARLLDDGDALLHRPQLERQRRRAERLGDERGERGRRRAEARRLRRRVAGAPRREVAQRARRLREPLRLGLLERARADRADRRRRRRARLRLQLLRDAAGLRAVQVGEEEERRLERLGAAEGRRRLHDDERRARAALLPEAGGELGERARRRRRRRRRIVGVDDRPHARPPVEDAAEQLEPPHRRVRCGGGRRGVARHEPQPRAQQRRGRLEAAEVFAEVADLVGVDERRDEERQALLDEFGGGRRRAGGDRCLERRREVPARNLVGRDEAGGLVDGGDGGG